MTGAAAADDPDLDKQLDALPWMSGHTVQAVAEMQRADPVIAPVIEALERQTKPDRVQRLTMTEETQALISRWQQLHLHDGALYRHIDVGNPRRPVRQLVLPSALRSEVLHQLHDLRIVGHLGIHKTMARVQQRFYWPGWAIDVARWCAACPQCAGRKDKPGPGRHPLTTVKAGAPFDRVALDILDTRITTPRGYKYILVISDYFTKWTDAFPLRRHTAYDVAKLLVTRFVVYFGVPRQIHSDQGTEFESHLFRSMAEMLGSEKVRTAPYRPQSDGQVERFNRSVLAMLSAFVSAKANDWDDHLPYVMSAYRSTVHSSTGCTPFAMVFGREQNLPVDLMYPTAAETAPETQCGPQYVEWVRRAIASSHQFARSHLDKAAIRQKRGYDAHAKARPSFNPDDKVRYYYPPAKQGNKFARPWIGPFTVLAKVTDVDYRIRRDSDPDRVLVTHIDNLKPYEGAIALDIGLRTAPPDDHPMVGPQDVSVNDRMLHVLGIPTPESPVVYDGSDSDAAPGTSRPRRSRAGQPPARYGWE